MKKSFNQPNKENASVEFGMEFGDLNASKLYEIPFMNKQINNKKDQKK